MTNVRSLHARSDDDGSTTLVMSARPLRHPTSAVVPIARGAHARPRALQLPRAEPPTLAETTQVSRRRAAEITRYRRLSVFLAISLAFVLGLCASLAARVVWEPAFVGARAPRDGVTRGESLYVFDGVDAKRSAPKQPKPRAGRTPEAASTPPMWEAEIDHEGVDLSGRDLLREGLSPGID